jgi:hypothetical protein
MFRFLLTGLVTALLLGGVALTQRAVTRGTDFSPHSDDHSDETVQETQELLLRITPAFDAREDLFALRTGTEHSPNRIRIRSKDRDLFTFRQDVARGTALLSEPLRLSGDTVSLHIEATPSPEEARNPCALRVELLTAEHRLLCDEITLWSDGNGGLVQGEVRFNLSPQRLKLDRGL